MKNPPRCVIVDDDPDWIDLARRCIARSRLGFNVSTFRSATAAMTFVRQNDVAAMVTDFAMPEMNGLELIRSLRLEGSQLPVVMISSDESVEPEALRCGAGAFILKGHLAGELCAAVERNLSSRIAPAERARS